MDIGIVSMRYAKALINYALTTGQEDALYRECSTLTRSFTKHPELRQALMNPIIDNEKTLALIRTAAAGNAPVSDEFKRFINLVMKNRREDMLQYISLSYQTLYRQKKHIGTAKLITAIPVTAEVEERIRQTASSILHARMELESEVDPKIEGGFIFDVNDYRLDASIATQLKKVKRQFIDKNRRIV